jgi:putative NADPH-quinone reductase
MQVYRCSRIAGLATIAPCPPPWCSSVTPTPARSTTSSPPPTPTASSPPAAQSSASTWPRCASTPCSATATAPTSPSSPTCGAARDAIERADHLVWVFPTYWAAPPAIVRGFVDRLFLPGWAFRYEGHALPTGLLRGRASRVISTMDSPAWWYRLGLRRTLHASFARGTLAFCGLAPVEVTTIHKVRTLDASARARWCATVAGLAGRDHRRGPRRAVMAPAAAA